MDPYFVKLSCRSFLVSIVAWLGIWLIGTFKISVLFRVMVATENLTYWCEIYFHFCPVLEGLKSVRRNKLEKTFQLPWSKQTNATAVGCCICLCKIHFLFCSPNVIPEDVISHTSFPLCRTKDSRNVNRSTCLNMCRKGLPCRSQSGRFDPGAA